MIQVWVVEAEVSVMNWVVGAKVACHDKFKGYLEGYVEELASCYARIMILPKEGFCYCSDMGSIQSLQRRGWQLAESIKAS
jgi:hypothetical protein